ncbi:MAG TPA: hypothetical protein VJU18_12205 [Vicinamibacteria bacterium]|nr:hypothetical protein [Vicinamibacteria bacterium]
MAHQGLARNLLLGMVGGGVLNLVLVLLAVLLFGLLLGELRPAHTGEAAAWAMVLGVMSSPGGAVVGGVAGVMAARTRLHFLVIVAVGAGLGLMVGGVVGLSLIAMSRTNSMMALLAVLMFVGIGALIAAVVGGWRVLRVRSGRPA